MPAMKHLFYLSYGKALEVPRVFPIFVDLLTATFPDRFQMTDA